jgi:opacity protein-like surface antigen
MKLFLFCAFLLLLPFLGHSQRKISLGAEMTGIHKKSPNINPFDAYQLFGPIVEWSQKRDSSNVQVTVQTGFSWVRSATYSNVYSIPLNAGIQYRFSTKTIYGLTGSAGTRFMFSGDDKARFLPSLRIGVYYDLFKNVPLRIGYERVGNSNGIFAQLIVYGFKVK